MNFKHIGEDEYAYIHVGSWDQGGLQMNDEEIWSNNSDVIQSVCSEPCQKAQIKVRTTLTNCSVALSTSYLEFHGQHGLNYMVIYIYASL